MKPLSDKFNISRAKLAYLIDATAAPVCIIAPISSWAAAVSGFVQGQNGLTIFIRAIPYNFYALFTIVMMFAIVAMNFDYSKMAIYEKNAIENGDLLTVHENLSSQDEEISQNHNGHVADLIVPVIVLIICCLMGMIYTGGFFSGTSFVDAFAGCDAAASLSLGSLVALVITIVYYCARRVLTFRECMDCVPEGFKQMVSPILVLTLAWSLKCMTDSLGLAPFVAGMVEKMPASWMALIPAVLFVISCALGFASGTSWGTFGILIPIALAITASRPDMMIPVISACMAGGVCGDHCSPIFRHHHHGFSRCRMQPHQPRGDTAAICAYRIGYLHHFLRRCGIHQVRNSGTDCRCGSALPLPEHDEEETGTHEHGGQRRSVGTSHCEISR